MTNKMQLCRIIYYSLAALQVSSDIFAHLQKHLNCIYSFSYFTRMSRVAGVTEELDDDDDDDDERKYRSKHIEQPKDNKLSYTAVSCWSFS